MSSPLVVRCSGGGTVTLTLRHPNKPNPLTIPLQRELLGHLHALANDCTLQVLVINAEGPAFCVGADLNELQQLDLAGRTQGQWTGDQMAELTNPIVLALQALPVPVVCAVQGPCAGAGVGLALAADLVLMTSSAYLYLPFVPKLGIVPDMGCTWFMTRQAGLARTLGATLLGSRISATQAQQWGLVWDVVEDGELPAATQALVARLAQLPPGAALEARRILSAAQANALPEQLDLERQYQQRLIDAPPFNEGVQAFLEKRAPRWPITPHRDSTP